MDEVWMVNAEGIQEVPEAEIEEKQEAAEKAQTGAPEE